MGGSCCLLAQADRSKPVPTLAEDSQDAEVELGIHFPEFNSARCASRRRHIRDELLQLSCSSIKKGRRSRSASKKAGIRP